MVAYTVKQQHRGHHTLRRLPGPVAAEAAVTRGGRGARGMAAGGVSDRAGHIGKAGEQDAGARGEGAHPGKVQGPGHGL